MPSQNFTIDAYDSKASEISAKFQSLGPRVDDIERALKLASKGSGAKVVELGSGDGRDAAEIVQRVDTYTGVEPSAGLLRIAQTALPDTHFVQETAQHYVFPEDTDVIFAFASLLHVDKDDLVQIFDKMYNALRAGGIIYLSLKEASEYQRLVTDDQWGKREFFYYSLENILEIAGLRFEKVYEDHQVKSGTDWLTIALKKVN
jgi:trans-aconitate methyltransferase